MAGGSTTGTALYSVGTGVIGDISAEARQGAMERIKEEGLERKRKKQLNEKRTDQAYADLSKLKTGGWRHHNTYLKGQRDNISNYLASGFKSTNGELFSGSDGQKNQVNYQNMLSDYNNMVEYSNQIRTRVEEQQALMAEGADKYTPESIKAHEDYMNMSAEEQFATEIPSLQLIKDPILWENQLLNPIDANRFVKKVVSAGPSGNRSKWVLNEEALQKEVDYIVNAAFTEGAGNANHKAMRESYQALYDNDPSSDSDRLTVNKDEDGFSDYDRGLMEYINKDLKRKIIDRQNKGDISAGWRDENAGKDVEQPVEIPVRTEGGSQKFEHVTTLLKGRPNEISYQSEATIEFDSGDRAPRTVNAPVEISLGGKVTKIRGNTILPKEGGVVQYGYNLSDFSEEQQKALKAAGIKKSTFNVLRIDRYVESSKALEPGQKVEGGTEKVKETVLLPIDDALDGGISNNSEGYKALKQTAGSSAATGGTSR